MNLRTRSTKWVQPILTILVLLSGVLVSVSAKAQVAGATLSGTVVDSSGGSIPNAKISIKNLATGVERTVTTNSDGYYVASNLLPASYEVSVDAQGFNTEVQHGVTLTVGAQQVLNLTMQVGTITRRVEVTTEAPVIQLASSDISAVVDATTVRELPLNGRSWTDLATLQPGVDAIQSQPSFASGADRGNRGFGQQLTISGARPQQNNYRLDGISLNDYANGAPGSVLGGNLGVDAIQEFSVLTSNYSAEYGKTSGGVVNAITRQGTNSWHGGAYEFLRNSHLDAANFFENAGGVGKGLFRRNQFGGDVGGPIFKNRTFFFVDYEGIRQAKGIPQFDHVFSMNARNGILAGGGAPVAACPAGTTLVVPGMSNTCIDNNALKYLPLYPVPNGAATGDVAIFTFDAKQIVNENYLTTRIDHKFSDKDSIFGTYVFDRTPYSSPDPFGNYQISTLSSRQIVAVEETHSFTPTLLNAFRFGFNHELVNNDQGVKGLNAAAGDVTLGVGGAAFAGQHAAQVTISGGPDPLPGGLGGLPTYFYRWNSFQLYDDAFLNKGTHTIKFGGVFERMGLQVRAFTDPTGIWQFGSTMDFMINNPKRFQGGEVSTVTPRDFRQNLFGFYVQDDWRWKPYLTLNLGLRYEMVTNLSELHGKLVNLQNITDPMPRCASSVTGCSGTGSLFSNPTLRNFEPRVGFAWDPLHNGKLAVRGGAGMFDVLPLPYQFILTQTLAFPFFVYTVNTGFAPGSHPFFSGLPNPLPPGNLRQTFIGNCTLQIGTSLPDTSSVQRCNNNLKRDYVTQWNLNVQYQLTPNLAAMIAYVGSRGVHQPYRVDEADLTLPVKTSAGYLWPVPIGGINKINTNFGSIRGMFYEGRSYYDAMEVQVSKRMSYGFQVQGVYTWSKSIDTSSATVAGDAFGNSISSLHWFDPKLTRGVSDFNIGHTLVLNGTWDIPSPKSWTGFAAWPASGWELGLIFTASDGVPFSATLGTGADPLGTNSSDDWDFPQLSGAPGCKSLVNKGNPNNYIKTQCFQFPSAPNMAYWTANCDPAPPSSNVAAAFPQCFNLRGNAGRNILVGPGITELDFSVFKNNYIKRISETFNVQFRAEFFNLMNHANFAGPASSANPAQTDIFNGDGSSNAPAAGGVAGILSRTTTTSREIQFAIKITF